jgi:hypothetical protein
MEFYKRETFMTDRKESIYGDPPIEEIINGLKDSKSDPKEAKRLESDMPVYEPPTFDDQEPSPQAASSTSFIPETLSGAKAVATDAFEDVKKMAAELVARSILNPRQDQDSETKPEAMTSLSQPAPDLEQAADVVDIDGGWYDEEYDGEGYSDDDQTIVQPRAAELIGDYPDDRYEPRRRIRESRIANNSREYRDNVRHTGRRVAAVGAVALALVGGALAVHDLGGNKTASVSSSVPSQPKLIRNKTSSLPKAVAQQTVTETTSHTLTVAPSPALLEASRRALESANPPAGNLNLEKNRINEIDGKISSKSKQSSSKTSTTSKSATSNSGGAAPVAAPNATETATSTIPTTTATTQLRTTKTASPKAHETTKKHPASVRTGGASLNTKTPTNDTNNNGAAGLAN